MPPHLVSIATMLAALCVTALLAPAAQAQSGAYPGQRYFSALDELHSGDYRRAERVMRTELRTAVKTIDSRWLDSICYAAGLGEALYQQGRLAESLEQFNGALDLFLDQSTWLHRVQFRQSPREDTSLARRLPSWAAPGQPVVYASMPSSFLYQYGQLDNSAVQSQGGVVQQAQFWKLDCEALSRAIAWTLYRRGDLLGPLGAYDKRTQSAATRLAGGGLGPAGHWSGAWTELWWGLAEGASGDAIEALPHLQNATLLGGRMAHRQSGLALLAQGRLVAGSGDSTTGATLLRQALSTAIAYEDYDVVAEATRALHDLATLDPTVPAPPLRAIADWTERGGVWRVALDARLALIERSIVAGDNGAATKALGTLFRRARDPATGWMGREADRLAALAAAAGPYEPALALARRAVVGQQDVSRRRLQVRLANLWYDDGRLSKRLARQAYADVLADPGGGAWTTAPLDALASIAAPEVGAFERWFEAAIDRRDPLLALRIIDLQRRREFFAGQPLAGRLVAVRWLLEAADDDLPAFALASRARVEAAAPEYRQARRDGSVATAAMLAAIAEEAGEASPALRRATRDLHKSLDQRERLVLRTAMSRAPTALAFPPPIDPIAAKSQLVEGDALLVFHEWRDELHAVVLTSRGEHLWRVGPVDEGDARIERLLREVVGTSPRQTWESTGLAEASWQAPASELSQWLFSDSRLDPSTLKRLWVVPDGSVWRAPLSLLAIPTTEPESEGSLVNVTIRYAPTPGWATRPRPEPRPADDRRPTWSVAANPKASAPGEGLDVLVAVAKASDPPRGLEASVSNVKAIAGSLVIDAGAEPPGVDPLGLPVTVADKGSREVGAWSRLPLGGVQSVAVRTLGGGEAGGGNVRRAKKAVSVGAPELHLVSSLLAGGVETALVERWPTGGARSRDFVAEWLNGLGRLSSTEAWRRSLELGRSAKLDPSREPRLEAAQGESLTADHPVWWSGYLLIE